MSGHHRDSIGRVGAALLRVRWFVRAPIWLYRVRLGALFGSRLLMLEHIGRRSGARRYVVLEVVDHPARDTYVVVSGFGVKAQWFRNIEANPNVRVYLGSRTPTPATASVLDQRDANHALANYRSRHARAWERFKPVLEQTLGSPVGDTDTPLPMVQVRLPGPVRS